MAKYWFNIWILGILVAVACFAGCNEDTIREDFPEKEEITGNVYIRFRMNLSGNGIPGGTRAGDGTIPKDETPGADKENAVNTIDLLVYDAESDKLTDIVPVGAEQIEQFKKNPDYNFYVSVYAGKGQKVKIYAAVNMTERMRQQFNFSRSGNAVSLSSAHNDYRDVIEEFVPGSAGKQEMLENCNGGCIPMTGQFVIDDIGGEIEITEGHATKEDALQVKADVSRIVAKIHVLATMTEEFTLSTGEKVKYAHAEDKTSNSEQPSGEATEDYTNWIGWIRLKDVRYMPNAVNKSTYLFPQANNKEGLCPWKDLNMDLESYVVGGQDIDMGFDTPAWAKDYVFYNGVSLHKENISAAGHLAQAEAYDETRYDKTVNEPYSGDRYTKGMYCPENYFDTPTTHGDAFGNYEEALPMVTHVSIAARLTPRRIVIVKDYANKMDAFVKGYKDKKEEFLGQYGLTTGDFTDEDVNRWEEIKKSYDAEGRKYFSGTDNLYREDFRIIKTDSDADAADIINWSLKINKLWSRNAADFENGKYPDGTFYVYNVKYDNLQVAPSAIDWKQGYLYLTAGAVATATTGNIDIKTYSVPHLGGWGYYFTYLDQLGQTQNGKTPYTASQVTRNTYYLITVGNFGMPGGSISRPEYIRVNTEAVGWDYAGRGEINLH